jgi:hypothetical protein
MESIQTESKPYEFEASSRICGFDTEDHLQMLDAAVCGLRRRQKEVQSELKKPGVSGDMHRVRQLLTELERIRRALRGQSSGGLL